MYIFVVIVTGIIQVFFSVSVPVCSVLNVVQTRVVHRNLIRFCDPALSSTVQFGLFHCKPVSHLRYRKRRDFSSKFSIIFYFMMSLSVTHRSLKPRLTNKS